jgi:threonine synthase
VPDDEVGTEMAALASTAGVFGETAAGVTLGALRRAIADGVVKRSDRVVLLVTGDGLKTPQPVADRFEPIEIVPDSEIVLEQLGVAV